jgi:3-hydroxy acid dehydrogenase / malonic semialdehyde reductase
VYNASKYAVHGFTSAARHDLGATPVRVTHISPGLVGNTEFSNVRLKDDGRAQSVYADLVALAPEDVADNVIYAATRPPHVQIADIIMYSTNQSGPRDTYRVGPSLGAK